MAALRRQVNRRGRIPSCTTYTLRLRSSTRGWDSKGPRGPLQYPRCSRLAAVERRAGTIPCTPKSCKIGSFAGFTAAPVFAREGFGVLKGKMRVLFVILMMAITGLVWATVAAARHVRRARRRQRGVPPSSGQPAVPQPRPPVHSGPSDGSIKRSLRQHMQAF